VPVLLEVSPEAHEALRLLERAPLGATLTSHDGVPVRINRKFIGEMAYVVRLRGGAAPTEDMRDRARQAGSPPPSLIVATH
jgi:hypothetical protein